LDGQHLLPLRHRPRPGGHHRHRSDRGVPAPWVGECAAELPARARAGGHDPPPAGRRVLLQQRAGQLSTGCPPLVPRHAQPFYVWRLSLVPAPGRCAGVRVRP